MPTPAFSLRLLVGTWLVCLACVAASPEITDFVGGGGYMLTSSDAREIYPNELATQQFINPKVSNSENAFSTTAYWTKPTCNANPFASVTSFTMEGWMRWSEPDRGAPGKGCCWPLITINNNDASIGLADGGSIRFYVASVGGDCADVNVKSRVVPPYNIKDGLWHHLAGVLVNNQTFLYMDGVMLRAPLQCMSPLSLKAAPIRVGLGMADTSPGTFAGDLDEIRFWKVGRSQSEIIRDMHRSLRGVPSLIAQMLFYYSMDTPSSTTVVDDTGNGFDATIGLAQDGSSFTNQDRRKPSFRVSSAPISGSPITKRLVAPTSASVVSAVFRLNDSASSPLSGAGSLFVTFLSVPSKLSVQSVSAGTQGAATLTSIQVGQPYDVDALVINITAPVSTVAGTYVISVSYSSLSVQPNQWNSTIVVVKEVNEAPYSGASGGMLYCDGVHNFGYAKDFNLPAQYWNTTNLFGTPSFTFEFWLYMAGPPKSNIHLPFAVGDSDIVGGYCDPGNIKPNYCIGKVLLRLGATGYWEADMGRGPYGTPGIIGPYGVKLVNNFFYEWVHIAMASDGADVGPSGSAVFYVNGDVWATTNNDWMTQTLRGLYLCHWPFYGPDAHMMYGFIDEFRVWNRKLSSAEIKSRMRTTLTGKEDGLLLYYNFDEYADSVASQANGITVSALKAAKDHAGTNDLIFAGCTPPVYPYCMNYTGVPYNSTLDCTRINTPPRDCYGFGTTMGTLYEPQMITSNAPVGGFNPTLVLSPDSSTSVVLNGYDSDIFDSSLKSRILLAPSHGLLMDASGQVLAQGSEVSVSASLTFTPDPHGGGSPYTSFSYATVDQYGVQSPTVVTVTVSVKCGPGRHIDQSQTTCVTCDPGYFQPANETFDTSCQKCPLHTHQPSSGQTACLVCDPRFGEFQEEEGSVDCKKCEDYDYPWPCFESYDVKPSARSSIQSIASIFAAPCIAAILIVLLLALRKNKVIIAASPLFLNTLLVGLLMWCAALICMVQPQTPALCYLKHWLFNLGSTLIYGSLVVKTWRLHKIFNQESIERMTIHNTQLLLILFSMLLVDLLILIAWAAESPFSVPNLLQRTCVSSHEILFTILLIVWKSLLLLYGSYLCFRVRHLPSMFNESASIAWIIYSTILFASVVLCLNYALQNSLSVRTHTIVLAVCLAVVATLVFSLTFIPKVTAIFSGAHMFDKQTHHTDSLIAPITNVKSQFDDTVSPPTHAPMPLNVIDSSFAARSPLNSPLNDNQRKSIKVAPAPNVVSANQRPSASVAIRSESRQSLSVSEETALVDKRGKEREKERGEQGNESGGSSGLSSAQDKYSVSGGGGGGGENVSKKSEETKQKPDEKREEGERERGSISSGVTVKENEKEKKEGGGGGGADDTGAHRVSMSASVKQSISMPSPGPGGVCAAFSSSPSLSPSLPPPAVRKSSASVSASVKAPSQIARATGVIASSTPPAQDALTKKKTKLERAKTEFESSRRSLTVVDMNIEVFLNQRKQLVEKMDHLRHTIYRLMCEVDLERRRSSQSGGGEAEKQ